MKFDDMFTTPPPSPADEFDANYWDSLYAADPGEDGFYEPDHRESSSQTSRSSSQSSRSSRSDEGETPSQKDTARNARFARMISGPSQDDKKAEALASPCWAGG